MTSGPTAGPRVAYIMSRFPKLTETFVAGEIRALERHGAVVDIFPLVRERAPVTHEDFASLAARAEHVGWLSPAILHSNLRFLRRDPRRYLSTLFAVLFGTWGSLNFTVGAIGILPKSVHIADLIERRGIAHVHCHFANHPALAGFVITRLTDVPFSFTAHGSDLHVDRHMLAQKVRAAAFVVAISDFNRRTIVDETGVEAGGDVEVIHCGVDVAAFRPAPRSPSETLRIACVGTLHEVKGQRHLIEAVALLVDRGHEVSCTFVGDGPDRGKLEALTDRLGLREAVAFTGPLPRERVAEMCRRSDVLVAPSVPTRSGKREGIPVVLMEAMASGLPVVASALSGIPELVVDGETGLLVEPGRSEAIAMALERLAGDPALRERLIVRGRQKVLAEFDEDRNARVLLDRIQFGATAAGEDEASDRVPASAERLARPA